MGGREDNFRWEKQHVLFGCVKGRWGIIHLHCTLQVIFVSKASGYVWDFQKPGYFRNQSFAQVVASNLGKSFNESVR